ncbi:chemotaxis protein CheW [Xanthomonas hortorum]|uniref:chemotaxis protein CheW n=1 Tax=Xanthomonas hortorum TaxID=56454 RepID=UPI002043C33D|nr:chemotaxis protein CheW [Xanthomonas hortorum]MCM5524633.1 chemotaxis protein CheW [Xanthomonas hortorum pv. pelargonii]MCM5593758.1 chemotaxis protein CheW [Xanthomonas hortorum pv. pelargonii]MCM5606383.1 chemotaxis protein CheW [Xanthomonas hortorum pv. pelargonii]MCM5619173.1 chemotaxis protein CheW [Xanthomonas hortorum pv. pelargonii]MCM5637871.1 chemotaxis protein CheW [Xanthomonas hortorum pv. pelargonii]
MSNHTANGELDDYLEGLLHDAGVEIPAAVTAAAVTAAVATADIAAGPVLADTDADVALAEPPVQAVAVPEAITPVLSAEAIAADFLAEMDADPAFGPPVVAAPSAADIAADFLAEMDADPAFGPPVVAAPSAADIAADFLAEMDADPAFATSAPSPFMSTADLMAEMDADPAFGTAASSADLLSEMDADPAFGLAAPAAPAPARPAQAPIAPHRAPPPSIYPQGLEALLAPGQAERIHAERRAAERSTRWLRLRCGEQTYALELLKVQEVVLPVPLLPLRGTPSAMLGIMNLRGQVVPVMDLGIHLGASAVDMDLHTRVVVLEENGETMGLRVSAVEDVTSLTDQQIEPPDNARLCRISNNLFRGVARLGHQPMILLDASHLLH